MDDKELYSGLIRLLRSSEQAEGRQRRRFGEHGFEAVVAEVAKIEAILGIHDLAVFTPR
jgi:hypothetical protein